MKKFLVLAPCAVASIALCDAAFAAPRGVSSIQSNMATTGTQKVRPNSGVLLPQVSIAPGEAMTLTSTRLIPAMAPAWRSLNHLRVTLLLPHRAPRAEKPRAIPVVMPSPVSAPPQAQPLPSTKIATTKIATLAQRTSPPILSSRHKDEQILLAQLDADLRRSEGRLSRANADLSESQKQLSKFTGALRAAMLEAGPDAKGLHPFVKASQGYAGTPYVWGGESRNGFDCSGFIIRVMRDLGYKALPHSAAEQFNYGKPIAQALLKPGDLVFFANTYKPGISHVGIYLGKRRFIHAAGTGIGTIVSSLDAAKFQAKYAGARRLVAGGH